ncbi:hypothetical protein N8I77_003637 [Diaporthe amygdali]|uniref:AB hydrolase-1 domain-containing protein n=1 Tax=Phomopsis amygdali TaxID=1214568 RepID=A0AAD9SIE7_PHOAM|nr:hypothetical protein N8I77_003637 [Diaporthe amygdali]
MFKPLLANPAALTQSSSTSSSSGVENQEQHRHTLIAFDLHGHGASPDATDTESTYTFAGYASSAAQALQHLGITDVLNYGCSLGGHVAKDLAMQLAEPGSHSHSHSSTDGPRSGAS